MSSVEACWGPLLCVCEEDLDESFERLVDLVNKSAILSDLNILLVDLY